MWSATGLPPWPRAIRKPAPAIILRSYNRFSVSTSNIYSGVLKVMNDP